MNSSRSIIASAFSLAALLLSPLVASSAEPITVMAVDGNGVETALVEIESGSSYSVVVSKKGPRIAPSGRLPVSDSILVKNELRLGTVRVRLYREGKMIFEGQTLAPDQREIVRVDRLGLAL